MRSPGARSVCEEPFCRNGVIDRPGQPLGVEPSLFNNVIRHFQNLFGDERAFTVEQLKRHDNRLQQGRGIRFFNQRPHPIAIARLGDRHRARDEGRDPFLLSTQVIQREPEMSDRLVTSPHFGVDGREKEMGLDQVRPELHRAPGVF